MRIVFAGTPDFIIPILEFLDACPHQLVAVYTQPDRRAGRGRQLTMSPAKQWARDYNLPVEQPAVWDLAAEERLRAYQPDITIVAAYGVLLPAWALRIPRLACVNIHLSLLPRWRGAAPVIRAIEHGDMTTGVSLMVMDETLDTGHVISRQSCDILPMDTAGTLQQRLITKACDLLAAFLTDAEHSLTRAEPQSTDGVCYARKIKKNESQVDWHLSAELIARKVRAFHPAPLMHTRYRGAILRIWEAECDNSQSAGEFSPGHVIAADKSGLAVCCGEGVLLIKTLQPAGKRAMSAADFICGHRQIVGERLQ